jgi:hypothetical protein
MVMLAAGRGDLEEQLDGTAFKADDSTECSLR